MRHGDHPRSRGEYHGSGDRSLVFSGSSPLSRGILPASWAARTASRIIPALAGNTASWSSPLRYDEDHPRSRGEYPAHWASASHQDGSSPLSRGIPPTCGNTSWRTGIIPALAGNTLPLAADKAQGPDHPRSRGEYVAASPRPKAVPGSSPLSRGIPPTLYHSIGLVGIIPALAGNTLPRTRREGGLQDHPRSRGEYTC